MVLARADPRRRAWAVPCFALPRRGLHGRARGGAARDGASGEGLRCSPTRVVGARADGAGTATTQTFSTTGRFGFAKPEHRRAQVSAGDASGPRPAGTGAQRPPCKSKASGALPARAASRGPRGSHRAREHPSLPPARRPRHRSQRQPLLGSSDSLLPRSRSCPTHHGGRRAPLPLGRHPLVLVNELGHNHNHLDNHREVAVGARRAPHQGKDHPRDGA